MLGRPRSESSPDSKVGRYPGTQENFGIVEKMSAQVSRKYPTRSMVSPSLINNAPGVNQDDVETSLYSGLNASRTRTISSFRADVLVISWVVSKYVCI